MHKSLRYDYYLPLSGQDMELTPALHVYIPSMYKDLMSMSHELSTSVEMLSGMMLCREHMLSRAYLSRSIIKFYSY
jgi:hypothetical protein